MLFICMACQVLPQHFKSFLDLTYEQYEVVYTIKYCLFTCHVPLLHVLSFHLISCHDMTQKLIADILLRLMRLWSVISINDKSYPVI